MSTEVYEVFAALLLLAFLLGMLVGMAWQQDRQLRRYRYGPRGITRQLGTPLRPREPWQYPGDSPTDYPEPHR